eukprot:1487319-Prymnesium_polylepis.2
MFCARSPLYCVVYRVPRSHVITSVVTGWSLDGHWMTLDRANVEARRPLHDCARRASTGTGRVAYTSHWQ